MHGLVQKILGTCERVANIILHPGANYTYMYNLHTVCNSAHVNGALDEWFSFDHDPWKTNCLGLSQTYIILDEENFSEIAVAYTVTKFYDYPFGLYQPLWNKSWFTYGRR